MKLSARNVIEGTITRIVKGPVSTEVTLRVAPRIDIVSVISSGSARALKLRKGQRRARDQGEQRHARRRLIRGMAQAAKAAAFRPDGRNRYGLAEWAGAFGDLGTLLPFALAYIAVVKVAPLGMLLAFGVP